MPTPTGTSDNPDYVGRGQGRPRRNLRLAGATSVYESKRHIRPEADLNLILSSKLPPQAV